MLLILVYGLVKYCTLINENGIYGNIFSLEVIA